MHNFTLQLQIGGHRAQLHVGHDGAVVATERPKPEQRDSAHEISWAHAVMVRVEDVDCHHDRAVAHGARVVRPPTDYPFGERQYSVEDLGGHL